METITLKTTRPILHEFARIKAPGYRPEKMVDEEAVKRFALQLAHATAARGVRTIVVELDPADHLA
jgi:hypothetical protein